MLSFLEACERTKDVYETRYRSLTRSSPNQHRKMKIFLLCAHVVLIICLSLTSGKRLVPFKREYGTLDFMDVSHEFHNAHIPLQYSPIYGIKCLDDNCDYRQFLTVRHGNKPIIKFSNYWTTRSYEGSEGLYTICPKKMMTLGMSCGYPCSLDQMNCGRVDSRFRIQANKKMLVRTAKNNTVLCPNGMYVRGVLCLEYLCTKIGLYCVGLAFEKAPKEKLALIPDGNRIIRSDVFKADEGGYSQKMDGPVFSIFRGNQCSGTALYAIGRGQKPILGPVERWTAVASEEGTSVSCPHGMLISQMKCTGECCEEISLGCSKLLHKKLFKIDESQVTFSNLFGTWAYIDGLCPDGHYAKGLNCFRSKCLLIIMKCVKITFVQ